MNANDHELAGLQRRVGTAALALVAEELRVHLGAVLACVEVEQHLVEIAAAEMARARCVAGSSR